MSKTQYAPAPFRRIASAFICALLLTIASATVVRAQSTMIDQPTPVTSNQLRGRIAARDVGDSRLTRHFYIFTGTPGDLVVTVESQNLNGDIDLFQAVTLRPLAKLSMYAGELSTSTSKSIYLRERETIILRVEARTPNDNEGTYRISFGGGFEAMAAPASGEETETSSPADQSASSVRRDPNTRRVSSVGARIEEPVESARNESPETSSNEKPANVSSNKPPATDSNETATNTPAPVTATTARTQRPPTVRGNRRRRGRVTPPAPPENRTESNPSPTVTEEPPAMTQRPTGLEAGAKLIIETRDGMRVERYMSTVRSVRVENGLIIVITRDGHVERHPLSSVTRMAIEP